MIVFVNIMVLNCFTPDKGLPSPVAGDTRCAENVMLTSFHTVFARMHNVIAEGLKKVMDTDDMDHVFFEARQINIALLNHITYNEFLPAVIGEANVNKFLQLRQGCKHKKIKYFVNDECLYTLVQTSKW